jgi:hypothetical protein
MKWFYIAHMRGHYGMGSSESILDVDLAALYRTKNLRDLLDVLRFHVKKFDIGTSDIAYKTKNSNFFSMLYFVMKQQKLKDWQTGIVLVNDKLISWAIRYSKF